MSLSRQTRTPDTSGSHVWLSRLLDASGVHPDTSGWRTNTLQNTITKKKAERSAIQWDAEAGWSGITEADRKAWTEVYPGLNLDRQLAAMNVWLRANPTKSKKSAWARFIVGWLGREKPEAGAAPSDAAARDSEKAEDRRRFYRKHPKVLAAHLKLLRDRGLYVKNSDGELVRVMPPELLELLAVNGSPEVPHA
jgi:hypothetical protein